jgi:hypothetical protein
MTDTPVTVETPTIETTTAEAPVATATTTTKPYDMLDEYEESPAETKEEVDAAPKVEEETETEVEEKPLDQPKATKDDKVVDGVEELPIKRMINGKEVEFKIKDAIESHVKQQEFNRNMDRRVQEISRREKSWEANQGEFRERINSVINEAQQGNFIGAINTLAKLAKGSSDLDITKFEKMYFDQLSKVQEVYTKMTPEQQEAYFAKRAAAEAKAENERLRGEKASVEAQTQLQREVQDLQKQYDLPAEEFWGNYKTLVDSQVGEGKQFKDPNEITAKDVVDFSLQVKHWEKVLQAGQTVGVSDDAILDEVARITAAHPDLTVEDIKKVIQSAGLASPSVVENLNRKVQKSGLNSPVSSTKKENANGMDSEDLDFLYRNQPKAYSRVVR